MRGIWCALVHQLCGAIGERPVDDVAVAGDPPDVGGAPIHILLRMKVEDVAVRERDLRQVAPAGVQDSLRLARRARGVEHEQRVLSPEALRLVLGVGLGQFVVPPEVAALGPLDVVLAPLDHEHIGDSGCAILKRPVDSGLQREHLALAPAAVSGDHEFGAGIVNAAAQALGTETTEHDGMNRAEPGDGEHRDNGFGDDGHVYGDAVALADAERRYRIGGSLYLGGQLRVCVAAAVSWLTLPVDGDAVAVASDDMTIEAVVCHVEFPVAEPASYRWVRPVEGLSEWLVPVQQFPRLIGPERHPVALRIVIDGGAGHRRRREFCARWEAAAFVKQAINRISGHEILVDLAACQEPRTVCTK